LRKSKPIAYSIFKSRRFEKRVIINGHTVDVYLLDTAGQEEFFSLRSRWINEKDAFVIAMNV
jgi:GTPase SAR1 family protein